MMTVKDLKKVLEILEDDTVLVISESNICDVETITAECHSDGRSHLVFSAND